MNTNHDTTNTSKRTHTPTPWRASAPDGSYHDVIRIYAKSDKDGAMPVAVCPQRNSPVLEMLAGSKDDTTEAARNAALIVAACNAHAKLVEACRQALYLLEPRSIDGVNRSYARQVLAEALAAAEGKAT
jgi:hypothetical protein